MDDGVPLNSSPGVLFRRSFGETAYVLRRGAIPDDVRERLHPNGLALLLQTNVRGFGDFGDVFLHCLCNECRVDRGVRPFGQRHLVRQGGTYGAAAPSWHVL